MELAEFRSKVYANKLNEINKKKTILQNEVNASFSSKANIIKRFTEIDEDIGLLEGTLNESLSKLDIHSTKVIYFSIFYEIFIFNKATLLITLELINIKLIANKTFHILIK